MHQWIYFNKENNELNPMKELKSLAYSLNSAKGSS